MWKSLQTGKKGKEIVFIFQTFFPHEFIYTLFLTINFFKQFFWFYINPYRHDLGKKKRLAMLGTSRINLFASVVKGQLIPALYSTHRQTSQFFLR